MVPGQQGFCREGWGRRGTESSSRSIHGGRGGVHGGGVREHSGEAGAGVEVGWRVAGSACRSPPVQHSRGSVK
eukprot:2294132-Rhodomonas_salina.1